jgi:hypothetical protein
MHKTRLALLPLVTILIPIAASGAPQRVAGAIAIRNKPLTETPIRVSAMPPQLSNADLIKAYQALANTSVTPVPQAKIRFSALHMRDPGYAQFHNADVAGGTVMGSAFPEGLVVLNGKTADATFVLPNSPKPYLMDCKVGGPTGPPPTLDYYSSGAGSAPVTNGHVLFVIPSSTAYTSAKIWSGAGATWMLFSCEATLMG